MAVDTSTKQMALTRDVAMGGFMERVIALIALVAGAVLSEPSATGHHTERATYAQQVIRDPSLAAGRAGPQIVMGVNVIMTTTYDEATKTSTCTIADLDLQSQIQTLWNALAAIDAPS